MLPSCVGPKPSSCRHPKHDFARCARLPGCAPHGSTTVPALSRSMSGPLFGAAPSHLPARTRRRVDLQEAWRIERDAINTSGSATAVGRNLKALSVDTRRRLRQSGPTQPLLLSKLCRQHTITPHTTQARISNSLSSHRHIHRGHRRPPCQISRQAQMMNRAQNLAATNGTENLAKYEQHGSR